MRQSRSSRLEDGVVNPVGLILYWPVVAGQEITFINEASHGADLVMGSKLVLSTHMFL